MKYLLVAIMVCAFIPVAAQKDVPYGATPSAAQLAWHEMDMYVLVHFTPTTFENKEWGYGDADPSVFNPSHFDANQIIRAVKSGGFKGLILVAKHHDGFCLWPTATTPYNISKSPWKNGRGDMVKEFETACRKAGLKFGVYCSPWDRNSPLYGTNDYVKIYRSQLKELYTGYGELFMSWHDGANGGSGYYGGRRDTTTIDRSVYYGWDTTWTMTRKLQPRATIFSDVGPDVRWVGNEEGAAGETSWATFFPHPMEGKTTTGPGDLKSDNLTSGERKGKYWTPAECDVPLRPGWFFHPEQNDKVKTPEQLFQIYLKSVGRGASLDLGVSPNAQGLLHENDVKTLDGFGKMLTATFKTDIAKRSSLKNKELLDDNRYSYARGNEFILEWKELQHFDLIRIRENIKMGQRIDSLMAEAWVDGEWKQLTSVTSIGSCRIMNFNEVAARKLRIRVRGAAASPMISEIGVFKKAAGY